MNSLLFIMVLTGIVGLVLYKVAFDLGIWLVANIVLHVFYCTVIGLCLGFLFLPKNYPVIRRKLREIFFPAY